MLAQGWEHFSLVVHLENCSEEMTQNSPTGKESHTPFYTRNTVFCRKERFLEDSELTDVDYLDCMSSPELTIDLDRCTSDAEENSSDCENQVTCEYSLSNGVGVTDGATFKTILSSEQKLQRSYHGEVLPKQVLSDKINKLLKEERFRCASSFDSQQKVEKCANTGTVANDKIAKLIKEARAKHDLDPRANADLYADLECRESGKSNEMHKLLKEDRGNCESTSMTIRKVQDQRLILSDKINQLLKEQRSKFANVVSSEQNVQDGKNSNFSFSDKVDKTLEVEHDSSDPDCDVDLYDDLDLITSDVTNVNSNSYCKELKTTLEIINVDCDDVDEIVELNASITTDVFKSTSVECDKPTPFHATLNCDEVNVAAVVEQFKDNLSKSEIQTFEVPKTSPNRVNVEYDDIDGTADLDLYSDFDSDTLPSVKTTATSPDLENMKCDEIDEVPDLELYDDLLSKTYLSKEEEFKRLDEKCQLLSNQNKSLGEQSCSLSQEVGKLKKQNAILIHNISSLFKTATLEIERKDKEIDLLRTQLDQLVFRRFRRHQPAAKPSKVVSGQSNVEEIHAKVDTNCVSDTSISKENSQTFQPGSEPTKELNCKTMNKFDQQNVDKVYSSKKESAQQTKSESKPKSDRRLSSPMKARKNLMKGSDRLKYYAKIRNNSPTKYKSHRDNDREMNKREILKKLNFDSDNSKEVVSISEKKNRKLYSPVKTHSSKNLIKGLDRLKHYAKIRSNSPTKHGHSRKNDRETNNKDVLKKLNFDSENQKKVNASPNQKAKDSENGSDGFGKDSGLEQTADTVRSDSTESAKSVCSNEPSSVQKCKSSKETEVTTIKPSCSHKTKTEHDQTKVDIHSSSSVCKNLDLGSVLKNEIKSVLSDLLGQVVEGINDGSRQTKSAVGDSAIRKIEAKDSKQTPHNKSTFEKLSNGSKGEDNSKKRARDISSSSSKQSKRSRIDSHGKSLSSESSKIQSNNKRRYSQSSSRNEDRTSKHLSSKQTNTSKSRSETKGTKRSSSRDSDCITNIKKSSVPKSPSSNTKSSKTSHTDLGRKDKTVLSPSVDISKAGKEKSETSDCRLNFEKETIRKATSTDAKLSKYSFSNVKEISRHADRLSGSVEHVKEKIRDRRKHDSKSIATTVDHSSPKRFEVPKHSDKTTELKVYRNKNSSPGNSSSRQYKTNSSSYEKPKSEKKLSSYTTKETKSDMHSDKATEAHVYRYKKSSPENSSSRENKTNLSVYEEHKGDKKLPYSTAKDTKSDVKVKVNTKSELDVEIVAVLVPEKDLSVVPASLNINVENEVIGNFSSNVIDSGDCLIVGVEDDDFL